MIEFKELLSNLYDNLIYAFDMGEDDVISFPVIMKSEEGNIQEAFFIYSTPGATEADLTPIPPHKWFKLDSDSGVLEFFATCSEQDFYDPPETVREHKELSFEEYIQNKDNLYELHELVREFAFLDEIGECRKNILDDYNSIFYATMPETLMPYYQSLRKNFDAWAESVTVVEDFKLPDFDADFPIVDFSEAGKLFGEFGNEPGDKENK